MSLRKLILITIVIFTALLSSALVMFFKQLPEGAADDNILATSTQFEIVPSNTQIPAQTDTPVPTPEITPTPRMFRDTFNRSETLQETGKMRDSKNPNWWLNSGGELRITNGTAETIMGKLDTINRWRVLYSVSNPTDTDSGYQPQNIFRLVTRSTWENLDQQVEFQIKQDNLLDSPQRNESNGVLLFNRYKDGQNLYYTGIRVDGKIVVKKKYQGAYHTLGTYQVFSGNYNKSSSPNLIPKNQWLGIRSELKTLSNNSVQITVFFNHSTEWKPVLRVVDDGTKYGGDAITGPGYAGIRTDFMDVQFRNYSISELEY